MTAADPQLMLALVAAVVVAAGIAYQLAAAWRLWHFVRSGRPCPDWRPPVSVLKPLCGDEPQLADNLRSFRDQDYPEHQLVFGVGDDCDPALAAVERLSVERPDADLAVVVDPRRHGRNLKVGNLLNMLPSARHDVIVLADSDVRVAPSYLHEVVAPLADPAVGLVTCLYVGRPAGGLWSRLGALAINHGFLPSALVARALGRADGCFGATIALRRQTLDEIGGLAPFRDTLADDWALGAAIRAAGRSIALSTRTVDIVVDEPSLAGLLAQEIRWGRTIAAVDRMAYLSSVVTQPVMLALLAALAALGLGGLAAWPFLGLLAAALAARLTAVRFQEGALELPRAPLAELALRELLTFVVFIAACGGRSVSWRGHRFRIRRDGTLESLEGYST